MLSPGTLISSIENRVYLTAAALLAGAGSLWLLHSNAVRDVTDKEIVNSEEISSGYPEVLPSGFAERAVRFCAEEVTVERSFVIFRNGTCVLVREPVDDPLAMALNSLTDAAKPGALFATASAEDGTVMVTYREKLFQRFEKDDIGFLKNLLDERYTELMTDRELALRDTSSALSEATKLGFLGRWCLMKDAAERQPVRIVRERRNHTASIR